MSSNLSGDSSTTLFSSRLRSRKWTPTMNSNGVPPATHIGDAGEAVDSRSADSFRDQKPLAVIKRDRPEQ